MKALRRLAAGAPAAVLLLSAACQSLAPTESTPEQSEVGTEIDSRVAQEGARQDDPSEEQAAGPEIEDDRPDGRGRAITTIFSGAELIREVVERDGIETIRVTIRGGASIRHDQVLISAAQMVIEGGDRGALEGGVTIVDRQSGARLRAARAQYSRSDQMVTLSGNPQLVAAAQGQSPALLSCNQMKRDLAARVTTLDGDVRIHQEQWSIVGDAAVYRDESREVTIGGGPMIFGRTQFLSGDSLVYDTAARTARLDGRTVLLSQDAPIVGETARPAALTVDSFLRDAGETADRSQPSGPAVMSADRFVYRSAQNPEDSETSAEGNVLITRSGLRIETPALTAYGRGLSLVHTDRGVRMLDRDQNIAVRAGVMEYHRDGNRLRLENEPELIFLKPGSDESQATLRGAAIERDFNARRTTAFGAVELIRENYQATGELATFFEDQGLVVLEGDPGIGGGRSRIHSEKILFYPEKNRIILYNRIRGFLDGGE